jgi:hypothetical protein
VSMIRCACKPLCIHTQGMEIVESFYPDRKMQAKTQYVLEEIFETLDVNAKISVGRDGFADSLESFRNERLSSPIDAQPTKEGEQHDGSSNQSGPTP